MEGQIEVALQLEGAAWDDAAFAATVQTAGGQFSCLDSTTALEGVRPAVFTNRLFHELALGALSRNHLDLIDGGR